MKPPLRNCSSLEQKFFFNIIILFVPAASQQRMPVDFFAQRTSICPRAKRMLDIHLLGRKI
jgi:hypothetical protein